MISEALVRKCITDSAREWGQESAYLRSQRLFTEQCPLTDMLLHIDNTAKIVVNIFLLHWLLQQFYKCIWIYICMYVFIHHSLGKLSIDGYVWLFYYCTLIVDTQWVQCIISQHIYFPQNGGHELEVTLSRHCWGTVLSVTNDTTNTSQAHQ